MENVKTERERASVPVAELVRRLAEETTAFEIVNAVEEKANRADQRKVEWDQVITLSVKPDQRQVDLLVQTRQHLLPNTVLGLASKAKTALVEDAYLEERDRLLFVRNAVKLLQGWSAAYRPHVKRGQRFAIPRPNEIEKRLAEWCRTNIELEAGNKLKSLLQQLDAKEVETGANCILWITDDPAVFTDSKEIDGVKVVSPLQLYLDLMALSGRGKVAA